MINFTKSNPRFDQTTAERTRSQSWTSSRQAIRRHGPSMPTRFDQTPSSGTPFAVSIDASIATASVTVGRADNPSTGRSLRSRHIRRSPARQSRLCHIEHSEARLSPHNRLRHVRLHLAPDALGLSQKGLLTLKNSQNPRKGRSPRRCISRMDTGHGCGLRLTDTGGFHTRDRTFTGDVEGFGAASDRASVRLSDEPGSRVVARAGASGAADPGAGARIRGSCAPPPSRTASASDRQCIGRFGKVCVMMLTVVSIVGGWGDH
jgi:hypothetical protein